MRHIVVTVGTSIITNYLRNDIGARDSIRARFETCEQNISINEWDRYYQPGKDIHKLEAQMEKVLSDNLTVSAEINSLLSYEPDLSKTKIYLIATDTVVSRLAAKLIIYWFETYRKGSSHIEFEETYGQGIIEGLSVVDSSTFREKGVQNLLTRLNSIRESVGDSAHLIFNISGGYKGLLPIMTIYAQLYQIGLMYQYEDSEQVVAISPMPLHFDWKIIRQHITHLLNLETINSDSIAAKLKGLHLIEEGEGSPYRLTLLGTMVAEHAKREAVPFFDDILGYLVEYKIFEYYFPDYPQSIHGYIPHTYRERADSNWEDIDVLLAKSDTSPFYAVEIKSLNTLKSKKLKSIVKKLCQRAQFASEDRRQAVGELWIISYSKDEVDSVPIQLDPGTQQKFAKAAEQVRSFFGRYVPLVIKHFWVNSNEVTGRENRMLYHHFLRSRLQPGAIGDIFSSSDISTS